MTYLWKVVLNMIGLIVIATLTWGQQNPPSGVNSRRQGERITLGSVQLYLGESRAEVLAGLATAGLLSKPYGNANFTVSWQGANKYPVPLGRIGFSTDRLQYINKDWDPPDIEQSSAYDLAKVIFLASRSLVEQGCDSVHLSTESSEQRDSRIQTVILQCGGSHRKFWITALDLESDPREKHRAVSVSEILEDETGQ